MVAAHRVDHPSIAAATEVPPDDVLPHHYRRQVPHLYSPEELTGLLRAADQLAPTLRAVTWRTLTGK